MNLRQQRCLFTKLTAKLIDFAFTLPGYEVSYEQTKRTPAEALANKAKGTGISNSLHLLGLAVDINLYIGGEYQIDSEAHKPLGDYWKSLHPLARWGGDFKPNPDGNHYSLEWQGVK